MTARLALLVEEFAPVDFAGAVAAGVEFAVVAALLGVGDGGLAAQPNDTSRVTWSANNALADSHMRHPLIRETIAQHSAF